MRWVVFDLLAQEIDVLLYILYTCVTTFLWPDLGKDLLA